MLSAFLALGIVFALLAIIWGVVNMWAGGMSDNPSAGEEAGTTGLEFVGIGFIVLFLCVALAVWRSYHGA